MLLKSPVVRVIALGLAGMLVPLGPTGRAAAQDGSTPASPSATQPAPVPATPPAADAATVSAPAEPRTIRFTFKGATFDQVLDFFSRQTGLPVVKEADVPAGTLDYLSLRAYEIPEALSVLNTVLQARGVMLRVSDDMLYLQKLTAMQAENIPTFRGTLPAQITNDQIVTVVRPLDKAQAKPMAEKLKGMVAEYGSIIPMEQQNSLVLTETAGNVRRVLQIIEDLDREDPEGAVQVFAIRHGTAKEMMNPIKALLSERVQKFVINQQGQQVKLEEDSMPGLTISFDERTNAIIAKGVQAKLEKLGETIRLLDVPAGGGMRSVRTLNLDRLTAADAVTRLNQLFEKTPPESRPVIIPDPPLNRVTLVGNEVALADADRLIREIDGGGVEPSQTTAGPAPAVRVIALRNARPDELIKLMQGLLTARQAATTRVLPGTDAKSVVISGREDDARLIESLITALDQPSGLARQPLPPLRIVQLRVADAATLAAALMKQYDQRSTEEKAAKPISITPDPQTNSLIVAAHPDLLQEVNGLVEELNRVDRPNQEGREIRIFPLKVARAEELAKTIDEMFPAPPIPLDNRGRPLPQMQKPREVVVRADPQTNSLIVDAQVQRMAGFEKLVEQLDTKQVLDKTEVRTYRVQHADLNALADTLRQLAQGRSLSPGGQDRRIPITINTEPVTQSLIVSGPGDVFERVELLLKELDVRRAGPATTLRMFKLQHARAETTAATLRDVLLTRLKEDEPGTAAAAPTLLNVTADRKTNTLIISAPQTLMPVAQQLIEQLDSGTASIGEPVIRVRPLKYADAQQVSTTLSQALTGAVSKATGEPMNVRIIPSPGANSLLLVGLEADLAEVDAMIEPLDRRVAVDQPRVRTVLLKFARAEAVAPIVTQLLNDQPLFNASEVLPWQRMEFLRAQQEQRGKTAAVRVAADARLNALILTAPPATLDVAEQLVQQLDVDPAAVRAGPVRSVRVLTIANADAAALAANIEAMFAQVDAAGASDAPPVLRVDAASNSLLLRATDQQFEAITRMVAQIDQATIATTRQMRLIPVDPAKATAGDIAAMLQRLLNRGGGSRVEVLSIDDLLERQKQSKGESSNASPFAPDSAGVKSADPAAPPRESRGRPADSLSIPALLVVTLLTAAAPAEPEKLPLPSGEANSSADVSIAVDPATNSLVIVGSDRAVARLADLARQIQQQMPSQPSTIRFIKLPSGVDAPALMQLLTQMLQQMTPSGGGGQRGDLSRRVSILADQASDALIIASTDSDFEQISELITALAKPAAAFPVRTITLERADASAVAAAVQRFYDDRAKLASDLRGRRSSPRRVSIIGDGNSNTLLIAAPDDDFEEVKTLVAQFDSPQATKALDFRVFPLQHARATEIQDTVTRLISDLTWSQGPIMWWAPQQTQNQRGRGTLAIRADGRLNALIATGEGDKFQIIEKLIEVLDSPVPDSEQRVVKLYRVQHAALDTVADIVRETYSGTGGRKQWWEQTNPRDVRIRTEDRTNTMIVSGTGQQQEEIARLVASIDVKAAGVEQQMQIVPVEFARAGELAQTLQQFLATRAAATNAPRPTATIVPSQSANTLLISAEPDDLAMLRDLLTRLDQPNVSGDRVVEIVALREGNAEEINRIVREQFGQRPGGAPGSGGQGVVVTSDVRTNSLIVNAPKAQFAQVKALIERLDSPRAADETVIRTYALTGARADEAVRILRETLRLDARGETKGITIRLDNAPPDSAAVEVKARVVSDKRSNSLIVTATQQSLPVIEALIAKLDNVPAASPVEYHIIPLKHAAASDVAFTLRSFTRGTGAPGAGAETEPRIDYNRFENQLIVAATADQFKQIEKILAEIDQPSKTTRRTDFVKLQYAQAQKIQEALSVFYGAYALEADTPGKQNVRIVADPASNSLVISADETEWEGIRGLLGKLDSQEYDASLQLKVMPLTYADAKSVANAINDAFQGSTSAQGETKPAEGGAKPGEKAGEAKSEPQAPAVLVRPDEWVRAAAEPQTNSVIVSASRQNLEKIERIVKQVDVADFAKLPPPQIIPVTSGNPEQIATALKAIYAQATDTRGAKALRIVGDRTSNALIVRAEEADFAQIKALALAMQQQASTQGLSVHVIKLQSAPARRVASAITEAYRAKATQASLPLSIQVDSAGNNLVVASTGPMFEEIAATVAQMDAMAPPPGQSIFIIELENVPPEAAKKVIETIGLDKAQTDNSAARVVSEPIKVSALAGRNALIVVASPGDKDTIVALLKAIDSEPKYANAQMRVVKLKNAQAAALVAIINQVVAPPEQPAATGAAPGAAAGSDNALARAIREQIRRLSVRRDGVDQPDLHVDLTKPTRVLADASLNAVIISSTPENVAALEQVVRMFDELPITDTVRVQLFPLQNIAADQFVRIVKELFTQGKQLARVPGTRITGIPGGTVGRALLDEVAISADRRTNTVIVAGKEEAVALVEVLSKRIDSDIGTGWLEPRVLPLRFADAASLAETLQAILIDGVETLPESAPLQLQVGRLRLARMDAQGAPGATKLVESDVFQPMTRLVIRAEEQMNALLLVGTPANLEVVVELVRMLDTEAASPNALVRIYPMKHASAAKLGATVTRLFDQQVQAKSIRPEDRVVATSDDRTNALIVSTSARSFVVLEHLLKTLDTDTAPELNEIRRVELKNASATRLAAMIQQLMDARLERLRRTAPETADQERAAIVADPRSNSLVVAASNESFEVVKKIAADLDTATLGEAALVQVLPMQKANVDRIAQAVNQIMQRRYADMPSELGRSMRPLIVTDPRTNSLLVAANPDDLHTISDLVAKLEAVPTNPAIGVHVVDAGAVRPEVLAPRLQQLMRERAASLGTAALPSDRVTIEPHPSSNSLIVAANEENLEVIRGLIAAISAAGAQQAGSEFEIIQLVTSRAVDVLDTVNSMYVTEENRRRGANSVRVSADRRLNALLVNGAPGDIRAIKGLVAQLDGAKPMNVVEIRYIPLQSANALETVSLIQNILSGRGLAGSQLGPRATVLKYLREIAREQTGGQTGEAATEMEVSAAIRESITLTPDLRTNTVIVSAPRESMKMIEQMIRDMDASTTGSQNIRIFKLVNADAVAMAEILTDLFNLRRQGELYVLKPREGAGDLDRAAGAPAGAAPPAPDGAMEPPAGSTQAGGGISGAELTAVPDARQQLAITVDSRTNSLLVSGTPNYLDLVEKVVQELDGLEANERVTKIYRLNNATAAEVARVVGGFVKEEQQKMLATLSTDQRGSAARLLEREITIVGDDKSNSVLVSSSPRYMQQVHGMIHELDVDPPQVLIQVMLAEVTLDSGKDWGVDLRFSREVGSFSVAGGFGLATALVTGVGVPNLAIGSSDFDLLIKALESQGRLQVLSNPSVMAANNQPARIQVGETIRLPVSTSITAGGNVQSSVAAEDIGVILNVTPSINPDGFVRMTINPEISELSARTTQINENFVSPIITRRTADTTVTVKDGQTIVLGGLISDRFERRDNKVPLLGDIPIIGMLFRNQRETTAKTELLVVLTPHVIVSPSQMDTVRGLTEREINRLSLPESVKENIRRGVTGPGTLNDGKGRPFAPPAAPPAEGGLQEPGALPEPPRSGRPPEQAPVPDPVPEPPDLDAGPDSADADLVNTLQR